MPKAKKKKFTWSPCEMKKAVEAVKGGVKLRQAALKFGVPVMTLHDHLHKGPEYAPRLGNKPIFTTVQEAEMQQKLISLSNMFHGLTQKTVCRAAFDFAERNKINHIFNREKKEAGKDWFYGYLKRNSDISIRRPEANRILTFKANERKLCFDNLITAIEKHNIPPQKIFNVDETPVATVHKPGKIISPKDLKMVGDASSWERGKNVTVCCCMSATGQFIPPLFIFPRIRMAPTLKRAGPSGSLYRCTKSGWMVEEIFLDWLKHFVAHAKPSIDEPVLIILDNHESHISLDISEYCHENGVIMVSLPPYTHPLYLTLFGPLNIAYLEECELFMKSNNFEKLIHYDVALLFSRAYLKTASPEKAISGFAAAGIWPNNPDQFTGDMCFIPAEEDVSDAERALEPESSCRSVSELFSLSILESESPAGAHNAKQEDEEPVYDPLTACCSTAPAQGETSKGKNKRNDKKQPSQILESSR